MKSRVCRKVVQEGQEALFAEPVEAASADAFDEAQATSRAVAPALAEGTYKLPRASSPGHRLIAGV